MRNEFNAFLRGWKQQGQFPGFHPSLILPYQAAVVAYFENSQKRDLLRHSVCEHGEDNIPFDFSYEALPLSMAAVIAHLKSNGSDSYYKYVTSALSALANQLGGNKPDFELIRLMTDPEEISKLCEVFSSTGTTRSLTEFAADPIPWGLALDVTFPIRSVTLLKIMLTSLKRGQDHNSAIVSFARHTAADFLKNSTSTPTANKEARMAAHIAEFFFLLQSIPPYSGR